MTRFAAIGIDHGHVFNHIAGLVAAGATFAGYDPVSTAPDLIAALAQAYPDVPQIDAETLLADPGIEVVSICAVPRDRTALAVRAMRAGKDVMLDKPAVTTFVHLDQARAAVAETGRIFSVCFSERHCVRAAVKAGHLVAEGRIGRVVQTVGLGPHRKATMNARPDWFWDMDAIGGIINDIASHQVDQFLHYTGSDDAEVVTAQVGNFATPDHPGFQDFGDFVLRSDRATGYVRVDWYTPAGLSVWGDGRLTILGTEGYIEMRKYVDIGGRAGGDHLFLVDAEGVDRVDCADTPLEYFDAFLADVRDRTETAMTQRHVFDVCRIALEAQARAQVITGGIP
ncbi:Gfo/Idh/MocA family oxidoreductase [Jannaschia sp. S6380]|uniref:Gfo/Idh/MocA family protein n=1 Tax=Jannaschia sp. S6380 TaxID=2926408 RepID=UPI001FF348EA|nr:Gfo/Idh/MocA family oxidoreductase [Jannaschia sp. S6380]MCK0166781.1 Gfo/Idh/MocA family oxidoreductase [Jannaschia sp. S6380]